MGFEEHFHEELNDPEINFFILDIKGGGEHGDSDFIQYQCSRSRFDLVKEGDLFIYRRPQTASETGAPSAPYVQKLF